jgi:hypothetical protein
MTRARIHERNFIMSEKARENGWWTRDGWFSTYHFPDGVNTMEFNWNSIPENNRLEGMFFGLEKRVLNGLGKKGLTIAQKRELADKIYTIICGSTWRSTDNTGKGGIKKSEFDAEKARGDRLGEALAKVMAELETLKAELAAKKGRK